MAFKGWPAEAIEFFEGLEADNSKVYWTSNKEVYERCVREPMVQLLAELAPRFGEGKIFRPYRDVRFSKDKSPYKTNIAATLGKAGYVHLSADVLGVGSGMYMMAPDQLERFRRAVAQDETGSKLEGILAALAKKGISASSHDALKTAPKGYAKDHPRIDLLRRKGLIGWKDWPVGAWLDSVKPKKEIIAFLDAMGPMNAWLEERVGPSTDG